MITDELITGIDEQIVFSHRVDGVSWFQTRADRLPDGSVLMLLQEIIGNDNYLGSHWTRSVDDGRTWSRPEPIPSLARIDHGDGLEESILDVTPGYHPPTGTVIAMGQNTWYQDNVLRTPRQDRYIHYAVRDPDGTWGPRQKLEWDHPGAAASQSCGCGQRLVLPDGDVLIPLSCAPYGRLDRAVTTLRCAFDGERLTVREHGRILRHPVDRGLLEPSLTQFHDQFLLTIRAEDGLAYVSRSVDGLGWADPRPWTYDDGEPLPTTTTQQQWLRHSDGLYLCYTRRTADNPAVPRHRAPLFLARVDPATLRLIRSTERVAVRMRGDGRAVPNTVPMLGNFATVAASEAESWITVGEHNPQTGFDGDTIVARIHWARPNETLVDCQ